MAAWTLSRRAWWVIGAALAAAGAVLAFVLFVLDPAVPVMTATRRDLVQTVVASGRVAAPNRIDVGSQITGTVEQVPVSDGETVKSGQQLVILQSAEARAGVRQAQVAVAQAEAKLRQLRELQFPLAEQSLRQAEVNRDNARSQFERSRMLFEKGFSGKSQLDDAQRNLDVAETQVASARKQRETAQHGGSDFEVATTALQQARAGLEAANARLGYTEIRAPADGILISRDVERGDVVQPGRVLFALSPAGRTQLVMQVDEKNLSLLRIGQDALASADAYPKQRFAARLAYVNPGIDAQRGTVEARLDVLEPPEYLRQDMTVSVDIEVARHKGALVIPLAAVRDLAGATPWVFKVNGARVRKQSVRLGLRAEGLAQVLDGLQEGDRVVPASVGKLRDGQPVRVRTGA